MNMFDYYEETNLLANGDVNEVLSFMIGYASRSETKNCEVIDAIITIKNIADFNKEYGFGGKKTYIFDKTLKLYKPESIDFENVEEDRVMYEIIIGDECKVFELEKRKQKQLYDIYRAKVYKTMVAEVTIAVPTGDEDVEYTINEHLYRLDDDDFDDDGSEYETDVYWNPVSRGVTAEDCDSEGCLNAGDLEED